MNRNDFNECEIVQDLLPLYFDDACNPVSKELVKQHLSTCEACRKIYEELKNDTIDSVIKKESAGVLARHAKKERNAAYKAGAIIALLLMIPIVITFIIEMTNGGGLGVFSVLVASMLLVAALTVVPLMSQEKRLVKSIMVGVLALLLIMFFVDRMNGGGEFILWSVPTIFGLSIVLFPLVIQNVTLPITLTDKKALLTMVWDTLWLYLTIFEVCIHFGDTEGMQIGFIVATVMMTGVWLVFVIARYLKVNMWIKAGIITSIVSIWTAFSNDVCAYFIEHKSQLTILYADFSNWENNFCFNANTFVLVLLFGGIASILCILVGLLKKKNK